MNETSFAHILFAPGVPEKLFDKLRAVSFVERPRRVCPVLTGCAGSFAPSAKSLKNQFMGDPFLPRQADTSSWNLVQYPWRQPFETETKRPEYRKIGHSFSEKTLRKKHDS